MFNPTNLMSLDSPVTAAELNGAYAEGAEAAKTKKQYAENPYSRKYACTKPLYYAWAAGYSDNEYQEYLI